MSFDFCLSPVLSPLSLKPFAPLPLRLPLPKCHTRWYFGALDELWLQGIIRLCGESAFFRFLEIMARRSFFTTFEIGEICEVNPTTVQNWVREKKLKAYLTPGGHRRVRREDLVSFMRAFGMPLPTDLMDDRVSIVIVDDDANIRKLLTSIIKRRDDSIDVWTAENGVEALLLIGECKPDLVILDVLLPGMDGVEVCKQLKANAATSKVRIVAITGIHDDEIKARVLK